MNIKASEGKFLSGENTTLDSNKVPMYNCLNVGACIIILQMSSQLIPFFQWFLPEQKLSPDK